MPTGAVTRRVDDADAALFDDAPAGWATPAGGGAHLVTDFEHDRLGRTTRTLGPAREAVVGGTAELVRAASWTVYKDWDRETVSAAGYRTVADGADVLINPVSITKRDRNGNVVEEIAAVRASAAGRPSAGDAYERSDYVAWTVHEYTDCCKLAATRVYHAIPASGDGRAGAHYGETTFGYDLRDRRNREVSPGGTIAVSVFDARGLATAAYVGTSRRRRDRGGPDRRREPPAIIWSSSPRTSTTAGPAAATGTSPASPSSSTTRRPASRSTATTGGTAA